MKKEASHTTSVSSSTLRLLPEVGLVDLADSSLPERLAGKVSEQLEAFASQMREGLLAAAVGIGLDVMGELVHAEVTDLAGSKGRHDPNRSAYRHGSEDGRVTLGGRRIPVRRPRVRTVADDNGVAREVHLGSYDTFASVDLLADHMVASALAGLGRPFRPPLRGRARAGRRGGRGVGVGDVAELGEPPVHHRHGRAARRVPLAAPGRPALADPHQDRRSGLRGASGCS
jgi:hypothetical protein